MTGTGARSSRSRGEAAAPVNSASVRGVVPTARESTGGGSSIGGLLVAQPLPGQPLAHAVDVEAELAGPQALARLGLLALAHRAGPQHLLGLRAVHHHDAVVVGDDQVAGMDELAGAYDRHIHRAERL